MRTGLGPFTGAPPAGTPPTTSAPPATSGADTRPFTDLLHSMEEQPPPASPKEGRLSADSGRPAPPNPPAPTPAARIRKALPAKNQKFDSSSPADSASEPDPNAAGPAPLPAPPGPMLMMPPLLHWLIEPSDPEVAMARTAEPEDEPLPAPDTASAVPVAPPNMVPALMTAPVIAPVIAPVTRDSAPGQPPATSPDPGAALTAWSPFVPRPAARPAKTEPRGESTPPQPAVAEAAGSVENILPGEPVVFAGPAAAASLPWQRVPPAQPDLQPVRPVLDTSPGHGTAAAKEMLLMNNTIETDKTAGPAAPGQAFTGSSHAPKVSAVAESFPELPARCIRTREEAPEATRNSHDPALTNISSTTTLNTAVTATKEPVAPAAESSAVERVARAVMDGVARVRQHGHESVSVVLKPDAGTELILRVEMRDGALSAQLHFSHGDRAGLDQHWDELQRRLAGQGVRLDRAGDFTNAGGSSFADSHRRPFAPPGERAAFNFPGGAKPTATIAARPRPVRGFETWA